MSIWNELMWTPVHYSLALIGWQKITLVKDN